VRRGPSRSRKCSGDDIVDDLLAFHGIYPGAAVQVLLQLDIVPVGRALPQDMGIGPEIIEHPGAPPAEGQKDRALYSMR